ncbi:WD40 repeat domain-containing protein [Methylocella sp.]|uniref:WD40 repeat domain-containing protein n=1 Tax=Methylocella sp. TaxID=1978226 RepID=UPI0037851D43
MSVTGEAARPSLASFVAAFDAGAEAVAAAFLKGAPALALADGTIVLDGAGAARRVVAHENGVILAASAAAGRLVTGGDDGRVVETAADGATRELHAAPGKWIDAVAARGDGACAWSSGRTVFARAAKGEVKSFSAPSTVRGLAFMPKGYRLVVSHYNGASLWFPNVAGPAEELYWKGSHLEATVSPDGRFVVTAMQENALHAWRLSDARDLRLAGYPAKPRSLSWSADGDWLATSGAEAAIVWPFSAKDGPLNKTPREFGMMATRVCAVAFHPKSPILAQGHEDGTILLCRFADGAELFVRAAQAGPEAAISALAWDEAGKRLLFGAKDGAAGLLTMPV